MNIALRSLWFLLTILMGILAGAWARQLMAAPVKNSVLIQAKPETTARPKLITRLATTNKAIEPLTIEEMDAEVKNAPRNDRNYMLIGWFGKDHVRLGNAEHLSRSNSSGQFDWRRDNYRRDYQKATDDGEKNRLYQEWSRQRICCMLYVHEIAKQAGLLVRPGDSPSPTMERPTSDGAAPARPAEPPSPPQPQKIFQ